MSSTRRGRGRSTARASTLAEGSPAQHVARRHSPGHQPVTGPRKDATNHTGAGAKDQREPQSIMGSSMSFCRVSELGRSFLTPVLVDRRASRRLLQRSFLTRLLQTTGLSLALMTADAAGVYAESVTVQGKDGTSGIGPNFVAGDGESVTASAGSAQPITSPLNTATASSGNGAVPFWFFVPLAAERRLQRRRRPSSSLRANAQLPANRWRQHRSDLFRISAVQRRRKRRSRNGFGNQAAQEAAMRLFRLRRWVVTPALGLKVGATAAA